MNEAGKFATLIGKTIQRISVEPGEHEMAFGICQGQAVRVYLVGDCCSETWFAEVLGVDALLGHTVRDVEMVDMPNDNREDDGNGRQESDAIYGLRISTEAGDATVIFRNSSNGYYGGDVGGVVLDTDPLWPEIHDDWTAYGNG